MEETSAFIGHGVNNLEMVYRLIRGDGSYVWVKNTLSMLCSEGGEKRFYAVYHDVTKEREAREQLRSQYKERLMQHYGTTDPNVIIMGHCNISQNRIIEISDHTDSHLLETFGYEREAFFTGIAGLVTDESERRAFLDIYLNAPSLKAFRKMIRRRYSDVLLSCRKKKTAAMCSLR